MSDIEDDYRSWGDRLQDVYIVNVLDEETLGELRSYRVSPLKIYLYFLSLTLVVSAAIISLIFFTPVKRLVPGYGDIQENRQFVELSRKVEELEEELIIQNTYTTGLMTMLSGGDKAALLPAASLPIDSTTDSISPATVQNNKATRTLARLVLVPPLRGSISAAYDRSIDHLGVDILAPKDSPVIAVSDGRVISADWTLETGNTLTIQHDDNLLSVYKHNSALLKRTGDYVNAGEAIAIIGNTGTLSDGPHLHFELWYQGQPIDPGRVLTFE